MKPIGLYAPRSGNYVGWHIAQKNIGDVWMFEPQPSGNYAIKSAATGTYINHTDVVDQNESPVGLTSNVETAQVLTNITYTGQFNIRAEVAKTYITAPSTAPAKQTKALLLHGPMSRSMAKVRGT